MGYFDKFSLFKFKSRMTATTNSFLTKKYKALFWRQHRPHVKGFFRFPNRGLIFTAGDVLRVVFDRGGISYSFEGICLAVKFPSFLNINTTFVLRNVIIGVGIELTMSYYFNRLYKLMFLDYKRKRFFYNKSRLYYLRYLVNRHTKV
jgi:ribosomal protein L19